MDAEIFRKNIRELLRSKGLKQRELADKAGVSRIWVRKICSQGLTRVESRNRDQLQKVCDLLGVSPVEQLWNSELLDDQDEVSAYVAKVEEILRATRSRHFFGKHWENVGHHSVDDLIEQIDRLHGALAENHEAIGETLREEIEFQQSRRARRPRSQPIEYAEKIRTLLGDGRPEVQAIVSDALRLIDAAYHHADGKRLEMQFEKEHPDAHNRWLSSFGGNVAALVIELAAASASKNDDELIAELSTQEPPDTSEMRVPVTSAVTKEQYEPKAPVKPRRKGRAKKTKRNRETLRRIPNDIDLDEALKSDDTSGSSDLNQNRFSTHGGDSEEE